MKRAYLRSLEARLIVRLALVYLAVIVAAAGILLFRAFGNADALNDRELRMRAMDLARAVSIDRAGEAHLVLPPDLAAAYAAKANGAAFVVRAPDGRIVAASSAALSERVVTWPLAVSEPAWFRLDDIGPGEAKYYGLSVAAPTAGGLMSITVAQADGVHALVESLMADFLFETAWIFPLLFLVTMAITVWAIRTGLHPIRQASERAAAIGPNATFVRLPSENLPREIEPLVSAVNGALDRLEQGFTAQRQFIDNAAHELRTPLAIVSAAMEAMPESAEIAKLRGDVARMSRLVERLLSVARLDALQLDTAPLVDLNEAASSVVEAMAPWAIGQGRSIALKSADGAVLVHGARYAIEDALRNLIENAVIHSPAGEEIIVSVGENACLSVSDRGPGVPHEDKTRIFERFTRGRDVTANGAGLGLAIVAEIMKAHGGGASVADNAGGGAVFTLTFRSR